MLVLRSRFKLCVDLHPGFMLQDVGQLSVRHPTLVICAVLICWGRSSEPEVGPLSGPPKAGYQQLLWWLFGWCTTCQNNEGKLYYYLSFSSFPMYHFQTKNCYSNTYCRGIVEVIIFKVRFQDYFKKNRHPLFSKRLASDIIMSQENSTYCRKKPFD